MKGKSVIFFPKDGGFFGVVSWFYQLFIEFPFDILDMFWFI